MLKQKRLKKQLGKGYRFEQKLSAEKVEYLLEKLGGATTSALRQPCLWVL